MVDILLVSIGSILGANIRYKTYKKLEKINIRKNYLILIINTLASFLLGLFISIIEAFSSFIYSYQLILFFSIGFLGSFSTFSSFIYDLFILCLQLKFFRALKLFIISASLGIFAFAFGFLLGNQ
tara:strand:+ start:555 stop:929 length:375 start_codon:yes stop_codon:yes gene_type:complete